MFQRVLNGSPKKAFTLIELLVVIAIIGLLSSIVLVSMGGVRAKARDSQRVRHMDQLRKAVELYYSNHESYPEGGGRCDIGSFQNTLQPLVDEGLLGTIPCDPLYPRGLNDYHYFSPGSREWWSYDPSNHAYCGTIDTHSLEYFFTFVPERTVFNYLPFSDAVGPISGSGCGPGGASSWCCVSGPFK